MLAASGQTMLCPMDTNTKKDTIFIVSFFLAFVAEKEPGEKLIFPLLIIQTRRALPKLFRLSYLLTVPKNRARLF
jgi:hypothetical protein